MRGLVEGRKVALGTKTFLGEAAMTSKERARKADKRHKEGQIVLFVAGRAKKPTS